MLKKFVGRDSDIKNSVAEQQVVQGLPAKIQKIAFKLRKLLFACIAISIGIVIANTTVQSRESLELLASVIVMGWFMIIALYHPLGAFVTWIFLNTFIDSWIKMPMGQGIPDLSFGRFAVFAVATTLLMRVSTGTMSLIPFSRTDLIAILVPFGIAISAPLSVQPISAIQSSLSMYLIPIAGYLLAKQLIRTREHFHLLLAVFALFGLIAGAHAIYEALTGNILFMQKGQEIGRVIRGTSNLRLIVGLVGETGAMGRVLALTLLCTLYYIMENKNGLLKPFWMVGALVQFGGLAATFSRTPLITFLFGLFILQFFYPGLRRLLIVLTIIVTITLGLNWDRIQRTQAAQDRLSGVEDVNGRAFRWQAGLNMWMERPLRGWGSGRYEESSGQYRADGSTQNVKAVENDYLRILVSAGLIGFLPYALYLLTMILDSLRLFFQRKLPGPGSFIEYGTIGLLWAVMSAFLLSSFTAVNSQPITRLFPFVIFGAIVGTHQYLLAREPNRKWNLMAAVKSTTVQATRS
jgi:O-antigen ligase